MGRVSSRAVSRLSRSSRLCGIHGVFWVGRIFSCFFSSIFFLRTHTACCKYEAAYCPIYLLLVMRSFFAFREKIPLHNEERPRERSDRGRFFPIGKKASSYRGAYRVPLFICPFVCKPGIYGTGRVWANAWDVLRRAQSRVGCGRRAAVSFVVCFG